MTSDAANKKILDSFPLKLSRSRLEPYAELILELHRRGRSYREIVRILSEHCGIKASPSTLNDFVRARIKRMRSLRKRQLRAPGMKDRGSAFSKNTNPAESATTNDGIQTRIAALKQRRTPTEADSRRFIYDPDEPLNIPLPQQSRK